MKYKIYISLDRRRGGKPLRRFPNLDRTGLLCNNVLELANNPYTVSTTVQLSIAGATNAAKFEQLLSSGIGMSGRMAIATGVSRLLSVGASPLSIGGNIGGLAIEHMSRAITKVSLLMAVSTYSGISWDMMYQFLFGGK